MKKESAPWFIAVQHYFVAGLALPFIVALGIEFLLDFVDYNPENLSQLILLRIVGFVGIWLSVMCSVYLLKREYTLKDAAQVVKLSLMYALVLPLITFGAVAYLFIDGNSIDTAMSLNLIAIAMNVLVFFIASNIYVKQDTDSSNIETT
ncbi:MAG: cytochrome bd-type quinol oxidase subunit 2 [Acidimicrobiales bacterium]|jgi:cytochrome bd-type quinol oxidase subunit 2